MSQILSIEIDLLDGDPNGIWTAEIKSHTIRAIAFPRDQLKQAHKSCPEMKRPGAYILIGDHEREQRRVYIGEGASVGKRLSNHTADVSKNFWEDTVVLTSQVNNLTKSHALYIESCLIPSVSANLRWDMPNKNKPSEDAGGLPPRDRTAMNRYVELAKVLVRTLGWDMFHGVRERTLEEGSTKPDKEQSKVTGSPIFSMKGEGYAADMIVVAPKEFVVQAGSKARVRMAPAFTPSSTSIRNMLLETKVLRQDGNYLLFTRDHSFSSPTAAAQIVCGRKASGLVTWKLPDGTTYADWQAGSGEDQD